jgi:hypothetical protein
MLNQHIKRAGIRAEGSGISKTGTQRQKQIPFGDDNKGAVADGIFA